jgi:S1-C subfamily serine protease
MLRRGTTTSVDANDDVFVIGHGGRAHALKATVFAKREFAGYWEYLLDEALFTTPPHPEWSGAALVGEEGDLLGIGSLLVKEAAGDEMVDGNMFVPVDLLAPILASADHRTLAPAPRPWLGLYVAGDDGRLTVNGLAPAGPAERAGVEPGDMIVAVGERRVTGLADLLRSVWRLGPAGTEIALLLARNGAPLRVRVQSGDRSAFLKKPSLQ